MENYGRLRKNVPKESNSMNKFVRDYSQKKNDVDFVRAHDMLPANANTSQFPNFSKLSLKRSTPQKLAPIFDKENFPRGKRKQHLGEVEYLPVPSAKKPALAGKTTEDVKSSQANVETKTKPGRELVIITGTVQHVLKTFKMYPDLKALYEVYGNAMKIHKGKIRFEHVILMRSESGPILQGFYFDFDNLLETFDGARPIRCIGQFNRQHRFHIHKIEELPEAPHESVLTRLHNVSAFALQQAHNNRSK